MRGRPLQTIGEVVLHGQTRLPSPIRSNRGSWVAALRERSLPGDNGHSCSAGQPGDCTEASVTHCNHQRYHESLDNVTPADTCFGRAPAIINQRERIKRETIVGACSTPSSPPNMTPGTRPALR